MFLVGIARLHKGIVGPVVASLAVNPNRVLRQVVRPCGAPGVVFAIFPGFVGSQVASGPFATT